MNNHNMTTTSSQWATDGMH